MARIQRDPPRRFFERSEFRRLASFSFLLAILLMIIADSRGPGTLRWLVGRDGNRDQVVGKVESAAADQIERVPGNSTANLTASSAAIQPPEKPLAAASVAASVNPHDTSKSATGTATPISIPPATGVTDEVPDEAAAAAEDFQYVEDGSERILREEMPAYQRILRWVVDQPYARLAARTKLSQPSHSQVVAAAADERGMLYRFDLHVRMMTKYDSKTKFYDDDEEPQAPVQLYEMWGNTDESRGQLYQLVVYDPPAGMPIGADVREDVRFVGYFFKVQGYEPAKALSGARPELAPTFIGRVLWMERPPVVWIGQSDIWWIAAVGGGLLVALIGWLAWLLMRQSRPNLTPITSQISIPRATSIDDWLDGRESTSDQGVARDQESELSDSSSDRATFQRILTDSQTADPDAPPASP